MAYANCYASSAVHGQYVYYIIMYQSSKFFFSCVSLVESLSREIVEIRLSPLHQCARWIMHYSPVNNKKITCAITRTCGLWTAETRKCLVNDIVYRVKFNGFFRMIVHGFKPLTHA